MINNGMSWLSLGNYINPKTRNTELSNDYNQLTNRPIITLTGTSQNPIKLWKVDVGLYILNGYVQYTDTLLSEARGLFVSVTIGVVDGKYVISAFIPFWEGQYEYILPSLNSETYTEHQIIRMITQGNSLTLDNIREYFPTQDYHPTTKKYVDETMDAIRNELNRMGLNNNDVQSLIKENRRRDIAIQALLSQNSDKMVTIDEEVHNISMDYSLDNGIATINTLEGDTLVNVSKDTEYDKILSYEQDIVENTNTVDLEVDGNVNPIIVGDTLVNVCTQNNPTAITNEYTVEGSNHFALQDEVEGNCKPIIQGNTIVNRSKTKDSTPLTTYVNEVEGNEMSLVDDTDTHVRVDKLVGDTMVNLYSPYEFVTDSYSITQGGLWKKTLSKQNLRGRMFTINIDTGGLDITYINFAIYRSLQDGTIEGVTVYSKQKNFIIDLSADISRTDINNYAIYIQNHNGSSYIPFEPNGNIKIILLEGDYTDKPIPQEYFEGLKNSYEDGYVPSDVWCNYDKVETSTSNVISTITSEHSFEYKAQSSYSGNISPANILTILNLKTETTYTFIGKVNAQCTIDIVYNDNISMNESIIFQPNIPTTFLFKTPQSYNRICIRLVSTDASVRSITFSDIILLEGDYTSNPPTYEEAIEHSEKYRCEVEVQGKNLWNLENIPSNYLQSLTKTNDEYEILPKQELWSEGIGFKPQKDKTYTMSAKIKLGTATYVRIGYVALDGTYIQSNQVTSTSEYVEFYVTGTNIDFFRFDWSALGTFYIKDFQLEEGDTATEYEPYYNQTQTVYLNSPLLKGDEVVYKEGKLCHYHRYHKVTLNGTETWSTYRDSDIETFGVSISFAGISSDRLPAKAQGDNIYEVNYLTDSILPKKYASGIYNNDIEGVYFRADLDIFFIRINRTRLAEENINGFKQWLSENPTTVVYELENPYYDTISTSELLLPITTNCKLLTSSNIPLITMSTRVFTEEVNILANTQYSLNFNSDVASTVNITLGGTVLSNQEIVKGYNKLSITTPSTLVDNLLIIEGSGVNISEVVVTEYDEGVCEYIEGLKSSFEDGWIPSEEDNLVPYNISDYQLDKATLIISDGIHQLNTTAGAMFCIKKDSIELHPSTKYTVIIDVQSDSALTDFDVYLVNDGSTNKNISRLTTQKISFDFSTPGLKRAVVTSQSIENWDSAVYDAYIYFQTGESSNNFRFKYYILEGDWTHLTEEDFNHLGQYKVEYKVTGKNKWRYGDFSNVDAKVWRAKSLLKHGTYTIYFNSERLFSSKPMMIFYTYDGTHTVSFNESKTITFNTDVREIALYSNGFSYPNSAGNFTSFTNIQIEEGAVTTEYEPYKESIQTVYLNSPLLEGDTIEEIDGEVYHYHKMGKYTFSGSTVSVVENVTNSNLIGFALRKDADESIKTNPFFSTLISNMFYRDSSGNSYNTLEKEGIILWADYSATICGSILKSRLIPPYNIDSMNNWLLKNPLTIVYELASPTYELIPSSSIVCKSYPNGHLDFDTNVHIDNTVNFVKANLPITYANTSTNYKLQFVSDKDMENVTINALGNIMENVTITKGLNKISFTSPSDETNILTFEGIGYAYISNVQLVATEKDIDYFKGLYSTYECGLIEDESDENYGKYEVNIVSYNAPIQFGKGGKIE